MVLVLVPGSFASSQEINPDLLRHPWTASWITCPAGPQREFAVVHFRKAFSLPSVPPHFILHSSGDNRYELFVNGVRVIVGPARGDLYHWRFETLDIAQFLRPGKNVLAAVVWNFAERAPMAQMTNETGLIVQGDGPQERSVDTNGSWKSHKNPAVRMIPADPRKVPGYFVVGPGEEVDGSHYPWGWETPDYDDSHWEPARVVGKAAPRGIQDSPSRWMLVPRAIPPMEETPGRLSVVRRAQGVKVHQGFLQGRARVTVPAGARAIILCDNAYLTTAYPELVTSGGRNARITLVYAESLFVGGGGGKPDEAAEKGNRNEIEGKELRGYEDRFLPDGGSHRVFRPLWWRTYRYLQIEVEAAAEPLVLEDLRGRFTAYPFTQRASFETDDPQFGPELKKMWDVGWRTARLCAHETYMDCPYYEQLQYAGDTRIQALISLYLTGDDRLVKNAIESLNESRTSEGLTQSRYPSFLPQYIPPFSLLWIGMMRDLWWYRGEEDFLRQFLPNARDVLGWFESRLTPSGLLGRLEWWDFVDWNKDFEEGVPPQEPDGQSSILSLQFTAILREAAELESALGSAERAEHDRALASKIAVAVYSTCWDSSRHLMADTPARKRFSQHANLLAVLTDSIPGAEQQNVMRTVLSDQTLTQCSYYFRFYLFQALKKAGQGDDYLDQLGPWRNMLKLGLTTWAETPEPTRSDCHAWSAHPNFDLLATVAGIESGAPGFSEVTITPHLGKLQHVAARLPHPMGDIVVDYRREGTRLVADVTLPAQTKGAFYWKGKKVALRGGEQHLEF
jgi:alpha-L-rhamnosidase